MPDEVKPAVTDFKNKTIMKQNLDLKSAAAFLCCSPSKLYKICHNGEINYSKVGRLNVFPVAHLIDYLEKNSIESKESLQKKAEDFFINKNRFKNGK